MGKEEQKISIDNEKRWVEEKQNSTRNHRISAKHHRNKLTIQRPKDHKYYIGVQISKHTNKKETERGVK